jgi:phage-related protein
MILHHLDRGRHIEKLRALCSSVYPRKEVRTNLTDAKIARVFFCVSGSRMVLLHGIVKKTQKTPVKDLDLAEKRMKELK